MTDKRHGQQRDRGLAFSIFDIMVLGLGTFGLVYGLVYLPATELLALSAGDLSGRAAEGAGYAEIAVLYSPFFALGIAAFAIVARAVRERRGGVRR
jgi:hypothetical protein